MTSILAHARCFILRRQDGFVLGFTEHDRPLVVDGVICRPQGLVDVSTIEATAGGNIDSADIRGVFSSSQITTTDLRSGLYRGATFEPVRVNWQTGAVLHRDPVFTLGEASEAGQVWTAGIETRVGQQINRERGRLVARTCDATFGDARCGYDATTTRRTVTITATNGEDWFEATTGEPTLGTWVGGRVIRAGQTVSLLGRAMPEAGKFVTLDPPSPPFAVGEVVQIEEGCAKTSAACRAFDNIANFRGFEYVPGPDANASYANREDENDGGARVS